MSDWQTMDSAPTDGTWVMLKGGDLTYRWDGETKPPMVVAQFAAWSQPDPSGIDGAWQFAWYDSGYYGEYESPTHWKPLET